MKLEDTGLRRQPFQASGRPLVIVPYASQQAAVRFLKDTQSNTHGLGLFHGPPLSGKTSIIRHFTASLPDEQSAAVVDGTGMRANELLQKILQQYDFNLDLGSANERFNMVRVFAMQQATHDFAPLLIVENTHCLKPDALDVLCQLADLKVRGKSAVRLILASDQPMLPIMNSDAMRQLSQRVTGRFLLRPLSLTETSKYIHKKLISGGCHDPASVFPQAVCGALHAASGGWPGVVDRLSLLAMAKAEACPVRVGHVPGWRRHDSPVVGSRRRGNPAPKRHELRRDDTGPRLILTSHGKTLKQVCLDRPRMMIGRAEHNELHVAGDFISRQHAVFVRSGKTTFILDLKSRNGTYVNGERISSQVLVNNDIISIGDHRIKFIDPAAKKRTRLSGNGIDETTIERSIGNVRKVMERLRIVS